MKKLILFSCPLTSKETLGGDPERTLIRDLLGLGEDVEVLFVGGDRDELCDVVDLLEMRRKMKARTWWLRIEGADHGIKFEGEKRWRLCEAVGRIAGHWLRGDRNGFDEDGVLLCGDADDVGI